MALLPTDIWRFHLVPLTSPAEHWLLRKTCHALRGCIPAPTPAQRKTLVEALFAHLTPALIAYCDPLICKKLSVYKDEASVIAGSVRRLAECTCPGQVDEFMYAVNTHLYPIGAYAMPLLAHGPTVAMLDSEAFRNQRALDPDYMARMIEWAPAAFILAYWSRPHWRHMNMTHRSTYLKNLLVYKDFDAVLVARLTSESGISKMLLDTLIWQISREEFVNAPLDAATRLCAWYTQEHCLMTLYARFLNDATSTTAVILVPLRDRFMACHAWDAEVIKRVIRNVQMYGCTGWVGCQCRGCIMENILFHT